MAEHLMQQKNITDIQRALIIRMQDSASDDIPEHKFKADFVTVQ